MPVTLSLYKPVASCLIMLGFVLSLLPLHAGAAQNITKEDKIKAAMIYQITQSVTWPQRIKNLSICLIGEGTINRALKKMDGKLSAGRRISVTHKQPSASLHQLCDILFIHHIGKHNVDDVLKLVLKKPLLTIGDTSQFTDKGGMISLVRTGSQVGIDINEKVMQEAGLGMGETLRKLAK